MINGSFENGLDSWVFEWFTVDNPISSDSWNQFVEPEIRVLHALDLPASERDVFILDGEYTLKIFKGHGAWYGRLTQTLELDAGRYRFVAQLWPDLV
ncbi:MAG: hypothetical protein ACYSW0_26195, partial [Planctomycetota bacterium]